jgi:DNA-binding response OmpR family regulator
MKQRILLAEDDRRLALLVKDYLEEHGFLVFIEENGARVARKLDDYRPDLVILDIMLPGKDGLSICRDIRGSYQGPIMMLTARDDDMDQVLGLDCGADDYVIKPAEPRVLLARISALLRRASSDETAPSTVEALQFGGLCIQVNARKVTLNQSAVPLSSHEFDLLVTLARQAGNIMSREVLFSETYDRPYDGLDRTVDVRISHLRKKLGDSAESPFRIKTVWGRGYLFVPDAW